MISKTQECEIKISSNGKTGSNQDLTLLELLQEYEILISSNGKQGQIKI